MKLFMRGIIGVAVLLGGLLLLVESCVHSDSGSAPARPEGPWFDHGGHLDRGLTCADCHGEQDAGSNAMPELAFCNMCHEGLDEGKPENKTAAAFFDEKGQGLWVHAGALDDEVVFDHGAHVASAQGDCAACHADVMRSEAVPVEAGPDMADCMACHQEKAPGYLDCASCHREIRRDRRPESHRKAWMVEHGRIARLAGWDEMPENCSWCHTRSSCTECHRAEKPRSHNNLWRLHGHAAMASIDRSRCQVCHTTDSCFACHQQTRPRSHRGTWGAPFDRHCVTCHLPLQGTGETGCTVCHRGTPGHAAAPPRPGNPAHMTSNPSACRECHTPLPHPDNGQTCLFCHQ